MSLERDAIGARGRVDDVRAIGKPAAEDEEGGVGDWKLPESLRKPSSRVLEVEVLRRASNQLVLEERCHEPGAPCQQRAAPEPVERARDEGDELANGPSCSLMISAPPKDLIHAASIPPAAMTAAMPRSPRERRMRCHIGWRVLVGERDSSPG
jgi:hypothetical protein